MSDDSGRQPKPPKSQIQSQHQQNQFQQQQQQFSGRPDGSGLAQTQSQGAVSGSDFFAMYQPAVNVYDEIRSTTNELRPHWSELAKELQFLGATGMEHRWKQIRRSVHQNGIAYSAYGDPTARQQHLQLDPLPHLITPSDWKTVDEGIKQRAELLNLMLADLYGPRTLLTNEVLPADLLFNHPHYHLPFHGLPTPGGKHLHFYAAEIVRSPQGGWWVKSDRTSSPGGSGFALENRIVISRAFSNGYRKCNVHRLAPYFIALRENLAAQAKTNKENPNIAILSAGAGSARYFEDSFLARYLGFTLVESNDLVVRSGRVMLKTLAGLEPIDVIFRRQHSNSLDPLEVGGSAAGIPGILQVIRDENVVVVNAPGTGLVESPVFMAFMPRICRALLNTDLKLPGVATWWGGERDSFELMLDRIDEIHLLPAFRKRTAISRQVKSGSGTRVPKSLAPETMTREERISLVRNNPLAWVGQERVARSSSAVWDKGVLSSGYISMRTYLTVSGDSWHSMPGGLVRVSTTPYESLRNPFEDGGTKDAWVLADEPVQPTSLLKKSGELLNPIRSNGFLPSRVADNLFWLGRYLERTDAVARLMRAVAMRLTSEKSPEKTVEYPSLVRALALSGQIDIGYALEGFSGNLPPIEIALAQSALDHNSIDSLRCHVDQIVRLAGSLRDRLSRHAWRNVQEMRIRFKVNEPENFDLADLLDIIDWLMVGLAAFSGFVSESMTRTHGYHFLNFGRRLEHAYQITTLVKNCFGNQQVPEEFLEAVLEISESALTYRSRYFANLQLPAVLDLLLIDESNPRSLAYQLGKLIATLNRLPGDSKDPSVAVALRLATNFSSLVQSTDVVEVSKANENGERESLLDLLENIESRLPQVSTSISNRFFVHSGPVNQLIVDPSSPEPIEID